MADGVKNVPAGSLTMVDIADIAASSYSPASLSHLRAPVPRDLPSGCDANVFTFNDAFEDLLEMSQGKPLPAIQTRYEQSKVLKRLYPKGEPTWVWVQRLQSQGLAEWPSPWLSPLLMPSNWDHLHQELERRAADVWRSVRAVPEQESALPKQQPERDVYGADSWRQKDDEGHQTQNSSRSPESFDELFSWIQSGFKQAESGFDAFAKAINSSPNESKDGSKDKRIETKDEYVDRFGYLHTTTKIKIVNEKGEEVGSETYKTIRPVDKDGSGDEKGKGSSWFWGK